MKNSNRGKHTPYVKPVQRVELSDGNVKLRLILIVLALSVAVVAIVTGLMSALRTEPGWNQIAVQSNQLHCGQEFTLSYDFTDAGSAASSEFKALTSVYSAACEDAFVIFSPDVESGSIRNLHYLNTHPNEIVTVDPVLYNALSLVQHHQNRNLYLGSVYAEYNRIFQSENEILAASFDPAQDPEQAQYVAQAAEFANDPSMIDIQLLDDNQVKLEVSDAYLAFIEMYEIETLVDFGWMKNAFVADYLAQVLADNGFTNGYLASFDGFTRNLDTRGNNYSINVFDRQNDGIYISAVMHYTAPQSIVFLRDFPLNQLDRWSYYTFSNGRIVNMMIDPKDGMCKSGVDSLICYGKAPSCAELLLQVIPAFISEQLRTEDLRTMAANGVHSIWCEDQSIYYTDKQINLTVQPQENITYTKVFAGE